MCYQNINWEHLLKNLKIKIDETTILDSRNWILSYSGGADSSLCLFFLIQYHRAHLKKRTLDIYYLNHKQNFEKESENERKNLFKNIKNKLLNEELIDFRWHYFEKNIYKIAEKYKKGFEFTASKIRRKYLNQVQNNLVNNITISGHSLSDWYETVIMRLNRSLSFDSLRPFDILEKRNENLEFRPLARLSRSEIINLLNKYNIQYWDDPSNGDIQFQRNLIRKNIPILNASALRLSSNNIIRDYNIFSYKKNKIYNQLNKDLICIFDKREYRLPLSKWLLFSEEERSSILPSLLQKIGLYPISSGIRHKLNKIPFYHRPYAIEIENWNNKQYLVLRRGRQNLNLKINKSYNLTNCYTLTCDMLTKKYYIKLPFGKKNITKILSEKKISKRQRMNCKVYISKVNKYELMFIPLSCFGLKDIESTLLKLNR
ncbi:MAG: tRNA lysidine(34) synthetase TilS [Spirochaetia bacterium]|nr:tRNA lysidine(34) synthetase TilS [Spirochaetia bacterium]